jgi:DUF4097 and DUF4098 domain-containing protein YvlB
MSHRHSHDEEPGCSGRGGHLGWAEMLKGLLTGVPWSERADGSDHFTVAAPASHVIRIDNVNGRTCVVGEDRHDVDVQVCKTARAESEEAAQRLVSEMRVRATPTDGRLEIDVDIPKSWKRRGIANLEVRVPRDSRVEVVASNGRISIEGLRGSARARASNGSVSVTDVVGDVEVHTSNAKVTTACTCGRLIARSSNGRIQLDEHRGPVDAATSNGPIQASIEEIAADGVNLSTSNGRIVVKLPDELSGELDVRVDNGFIRNDHAACRKIRESNGRVRGTLGRGGPLIRLRTSNGSISLR